MNIRTVWGIKMIAEDIHLEEGEIKDKIVELIHVRLEDNNL